MFRTTTTTITTAAITAATDQLELTLETLKDLTVTGREAADVKGGKTGWAPNCYCGSM